MESVRTRCGAQARGKNMLPGNAVGKDLARSPPLAIGDPMSLDQSTDPSLDMVGDKAG